MSAQPWLSSPSRCSLGTTTSVKNTSLKSKKSGSLNSANGRASTPGDFMSMMRTLIPLCFGTSGSVRTKHMFQSEWCAPDVQTF